MKNTARLVLAALTLLCAAGFTACSDEKKVETPDGKVEYKKTSGGVQVTSKDGTVSMEGDDKSGHVKIKDKDGKNVEMTYTRDKLAEGFPKDIPLYASAKIMMSQLLDGKSAVATLTTRDSPDAVFKFYKTALPKNGWTVENEITMNGVSFLHGTKAGNSLNVQIAQQGDETGITLATAQDEK
jgi:hypothetical protein